MTCQLNSTYVVTRFPVVADHTITPTDVRSPGDRGSGMENKEKQWSTARVPHPPPFPNNDYLLLPGNVWDVSKNNGSVIAGLILISGGSGRLFFIFGPALPVALLYYIECENG